MRAVLRRARIWRYDRAQPPQCFALDLPAALFPDAEPLADRLVALSAAAGSGRNDG
jgi:hypothetical protein